MEMMKKMLDITRNDFFLQNLIDLLLLAKQIIKSRLNMLSYVKYNYNMVNEVVMKNKEDLKKPHWVHDTADDPTSVTGKRYLVTCTCSECGYHANMEKPVCQSNRIGTDGIPTEGIRMSDLHAQWKILYSQ